MSKTIISLQRSAYRYPDEQEFGRCFSGERKVGENGGEVGKVLGKRAAKL